MQNLRNNFEFLVSCIDCTIINNPK